MKKLLVICVVLCWSAINASAATFNMDFESLGVSGTLGGSADGTTYTEDGMTMTHIYGHFDRYLTHTTLSPTPGYNPVLHEGNGGSGVSFSLGGTAFDLLSIDVLGWLFNGTTVGEETTASFMSSSGGLFQINAAEFASNFTGLIDFTALAGFNNITGFTITLPNPGTICSIGDCPNFAFDNVTFRTPPSLVPLPAAGWMLLAGLGMLFGFRRKA